LVVPLVVLMFVQACGLVILPQLGEKPSNIIIQEPTALGASETATVTPKVTYLPTYTPVTKTSTPTATRTAIPLTPTPTLTACMRAGGKVEVFEITTKLLPNPLVYRIYLPPCYDEEPERSYPVLYLIHGQTYSDTQWDRLGVPEAADRLISAGETGPFIVVMPRDRIWLEPTEDKFGLAVEQSLIPWVDEQYRTIPDRAHRAIGGLSRGGAWAVDIGLSHWEMFSAVGIHSGFVFQSEVQAIYLWLYNIPEGKAPRIYMDIGNDDRPEMMEGTIWLEELLTKYDIPHEWHMFVGEHEEAYWQAHVEDYLRWYTMDWEK
jgi:enterochelin esterase-like enzyme